MENFDVYTITGEEEFVDGEKMLGFNMIDFWRFQFPNIYDYHGELAEFIVSMALGKTKPDNKDIWTLYDIDYIADQGKAVKIEVKASAYYHAWQTENSKISEQRTFSIAKSHSSYIEQSEILSGTRSTLSGDDRFERPSDIYVFCLNNGRNREEAYTLNVQNWEFYVVPTAKINDECGDNKTISLNRIHKMNIMPVSFGQLKAEIEKAASSI